MDRKRKKEGEKKTPTFISQDIYGCPFFLFFLENLWVPFFLTVTVPVPVSVQPVTVMVPVSVPPLTVTASVPLVAGLSTATTVGIAVAATFFVIGAGIAACCYYRSRNKKEQKMEQKRTSIFLIGKFMGVLFFSFHS